MSHQVKRLYESSLVWDQALQLGQKNVVAAIRDFFPPGMKRVLDVGCGDGKVTDSLIQHLKQPIVGLDFSAEALSRCNFETVQGEAESLPFPDQDFDLVLSADMLEHLPDDIEKQAWHELFRVAAHAVLVVVPFRENLLLATARCDACGQRYHVNWHMRSYDFADLVAKAPPGWEVDKIILSGEPWPPFSDMETQFRRFMLDEWSGWGGGFCPNCGTSGHEAVTPSTFTGLTAMALGKAIYAEAKRAEDARFHSEIIVLYRRQSQASWPVDVSPPRLVEAGSASQIGIPEDGVFINLQPYPLYGRSVQAVEGGVVVQLPVYDSPTALTLCTDEIGPVSIDLVLEDGKGVVFSGQVSLGEGGTSTTLTLPRPLIAGYYGVLLRLAKGTPALTVSLDDSICGRRILPGAEEYCYLKDRFGEIPLYLQVTEPIWISDKAYADAQNASYCDGPECFDHINAMLQSLLGDVRVHLPKQTQPMISVGGTLIEMAAVLTDTNAKLVETSARLDDANRTLKILRGRMEVRVGDRLRRMIRKAYIGKKKS